MEEKKKSKGSLIVMVLLVIVILGLVGYICYDKGVIFKSEPKKVEEKNVNKETNTKNDIKEAEDAEKNTYKSLIIDNSKCLTECSDIEYRLGSSVAGDGVEVWIDESKNKISVNIDRNLLKSIYVYDFYSDESNYSFEFSKRVQDTFVGHIGQDASMPILFVLLEDGSVQKIDLYSKIKTGNANQKEYTEVKDVIKFYSASARSKKSPIGSIITVLAQRADGSFYDLSRTQ